MIVFLALQMLTIDKLFLRNSLGFIAHKYIRQNSVKLNSNENAFKQEFDGNHIQTTPFQKALLGFGSAAMSLFDPARGG